MKIDNLLLDVYPEAKDFVAWVREHGDLARARIADKSKPPHGLQSAIYLRDVAEQERYWVITLTGAEAQDWIREEYEKDPKWSCPLNDPRTWAELGIRLDRDNPFIYIATQDGYEWAERHIEAGDGFVFGKEKEHFEKLRQLCSIIFNKKISPEELDESEPYRKLTLET